uniref:Rano class II histocompatibility antigen, A beta chain n=1 Tax=Danio rerio TaxID=7955 RepID=A0A0R4ISW2_DANRE|nr:rano class II histocompatibility antigen, A beta chain-like [Danio rerio]|eukprot:XP_009302413.1 rano class II histocompatibility antigen, A beta chain-like [Danio rerio]
MSLIKLSCCPPILALFVLIGAENANEYYATELSRCIYTSHDLSDMVFIDNYYFNKHLVTQFNSTLGKFVGFTEYGIKNAEIWNNSSLLQKEISNVDSECRFYIKTRDKAVRDKAVKPTVVLSSVTQANGRHPAMLICSAYEFYPRHIKVSWLKGGKSVTSEVTSTMEMADGDWYYQIHSELEYTPGPGEKISCLVEHASSSEPMIYDWDPSLPESERNKIAVGASGLVMGFIIAAVGILYYRKKSTGMIPIPH